LGAHDEVSGTVVLLGGITISIFAIMLRNRLKGGRATLRSVGDDFCYCHFNLPQQWFHLLRVV
jgi:hypothetical protein